jgi:hypothetical protein
MAVPLRFTRGEAEVHATPRPSIPGTWYPRIIRAIEVNAEIPGLHGTDLRPTGINSL